MRGHAAGLGLAFGGQLLSLFLTAAIVLSGVLAPAAPGVLEGVETRRVQNGWGLEETAGPDVLLLALDD